MPEELGAKNSLDSKSNVVPDLVAKTISNASLQKCMLFRVEISVVSVVFDTTIALRV